VGFSDCVLEVRGWVMNIADIIEAYCRALTVEELAGLMKVSDKTVRRHIRSGSLPAYHIGSLVRLDPAQTAKWLRARMK